MVRLNALVARQRRELDKLRSVAAARSVVDLARGMLMEQLGCTPAEAQRQLTRLAAESGVTTTELAALITHQDPPGEPADPGMPRVSLARAEIETAASGSAVASALLGEALGTMVVCWPEPAAEFPGPLRRQLTSVADVAAQALGIRLSQGDLPADYEAAGVLALLGNLFDECVFARALRDPGGRVTDFRVDHVSDGFRDPAGRGAADLTGRHLLELYPEALTAGGLFDRCLAALEGGEPQRLPEAVAAQAAPGTPPSGIRIARLYDGVVIAWRVAGDAGRLAALLQHAQRLGRIGGWEEDVPGGEVSWTEPTFALFGLPPGDPVPVADLPSHVVAEDVPAVQGFREALLHGRMESAAAFRVVRADDGSVRQIRAYAEPVTGPGGTVIAMRGVYQDVSADYHTRLAFAAAREQLADTEERAAEEHRLAIRLQEAITPRSAAPDELVEAAGLDVAARYRPSGEGNLVSGDWYDTVLLPSKKVLLVVGDIAGHGLDAVTGMVAVRNSLRGLAITGAGPGTLLDWLNSAAAHFTDGVLGTAICGLYDPAGRSLCWARAGHLPPILVRDGKAEQLPLPEGLLLGADPDARYAEEVTSLRLGDTLLLFTDGLIERRDESIDDAIASLLRAASRPVGAIGGYADHLLDQAASNTGDDACLVAVRVR